MGPRFIIHCMDIQPDPHEFTLEAWDANAEIWDARMGEMKVTTSTHRVRPLICVTDG
jgi:hypothetical protein